MHKETNAVRDGTRRDNRVQVFLTQREKARLERYAERLGVKPGAGLRILAAHGLRDSEDGDGSA